MMDIRMLPSNDDHECSSVSLFHRTLCHLREIADTGVTVNAVTPGAVDTNIRVGSTDEQEAKLAADIPAGRTATTDEVAAVITFLSSKDAGYLTGTTMDINGGSHIH
jgi:2-hydroxycyclohexanecarboxyl-CoA dehydrogenase